MVVGSRIKLPLKIGKTLKGKIENSKGVQY